MRKGNNTVKNHIIYAEFTAILVTFTAIAEFRADNIPSAKGAYPDIIPYKTVVGVLSLSVKDSFYLIFGQENTVLNGYLTLVNLFKGLSEVRWSSYIAYIMRR